MLQTAVPVTIHISAIHKIQRVQKRGQLITRIANPTQTILVTVDRFHPPPGSEGPKALAVTRIAIAIPAIPMTLDSVQAPEGSEGPKATTVAGMATLTPSIPVTVDIAHSLRGFEAPKATTLTKDLDPDPHHPCHCSALRKGKLSCVDGRKFF